MTRTIQPATDGCTWTFHPTTVRVYDAIEAHYDDRYSATWADVARTAGVSLSTLRRHLAVLESEDVMYIERGWRGRFGDCGVLMDMHAPIEYDCEEVQLD